MGNQNPNKKKIDSPFNQKWYKGIFLSQVTAEVKEKYRQPWSLEIKLEEYIALQKGIYHNTDNKTSSMEKCRLAELLKKSIEHYNSIEGKN